MDEAIAEKFEEQGLILARIDERTEVIKEELVKQNDRLTWLERRDAIGTLLTGLLAAAAVFFGLKK